MMYQDIYNCICQNTTKWRYTIQYVKPTAQLVFKNRFPKGGPTCRRQVVNPRHQSEMFFAFEWFYAYHILCWAIGIYIYIYITRFISRFLRELAAICMTLCLNYASSHIYLYGFSCSNTWQSTRQSMVNIVVLKPICCQVALIIY